jgi:hypothetical protein
MCFRERNIDFYVETVAARAYKPRQRLELVRMEFLERNREAAQIHKSNGVRVPSGNLFGAHLRTAAVRCRDAVC